MADKADGSCKSQLWPCSNPLALSEQEHMHIGDYCAFKAIGFGGYGKVMLGQHLPTKQEVAIKIIYKAELSDYSLQEIYREVDILVTLDHPNIVKLIDYIDTNNALYLIMEFASGGDVFDYIIKKGKLCEDEARAFFRQVITAVDYCHKNNVAHRDLKAENLLLDEDNIIKLADFGLSKSFSPGQRLRTPCGTTSYKAPELHLNKTYHGPAADTWSLGVLLYMMVTADLPFLGWSEIETRERVLRGQYFIPWYLSFDCERLLKKLLVRNPKKRAALEDIMKDKWLNTGYDVLQPYVVPEDSNNTDAAGPSSAAVENRPCNTRKRKRERLPSFLPIRDTSEASSGALSQSGHSSTLPLKKRKLISYP